TSLLLGGAGRGDGRPTEPAVRDRQIEPRVTPRELLDRDAHHEVALGRPFLRALLAAADRVPARELPHHGEEVPWLLVLPLVVLARDRTHRLFRERVDHPLLVGDVLRQFEVDHDWSPHTMARPSKAAKPRALRSHSSTMWSRMYPWPPRTCTALSVIVSAAWLA